VVGGGWSEDPARVDIGVEREMKGGEFGHGGERVSECAVEGTEDMSGGVDGDGEGVHDAGDGGIVGESDDDGKIVVRGGEDEMAVEDALHDGLEEGVGAAERGEVGRGEVRGDEVVELDGETRERHGGSGVDRAREGRVNKRSGTRLALFAPCAHYHCHAYSPVCTTVRRMVRTFSFPLAVPHSELASTLSEAFSQLWRAHV
jgi:hypothetical protein